MSSGSFDRAFVRRLCLAGLVILAAFTCLMGCTTPQQAYVSQHPQLSADHRRIIASGKLVDHDPVEGMSREEIRLTMGVDPTQVTRINDEDAWVWVKRKLAPASALQQTGRSASPGAGSFSNQPVDTEETPDPKVNIRTTVFFQGNLATRVDVTEEPIEP
jgi:hypothetical protein